MRIQHNIPAMSSYRNYTNNVSSLSKNLEKLSSGYKINRAGDDAAGLAISEKMRAQITGLETAQKNAKDGISLVQTAEGALTEVHDMLNRMYELAEQSANGTYQDEVDREQLQKEIVSLRTEINRIADSSNFNGINLLDGSLSSSGSSGTSTSSSIEGMDRILTSVIGKGDDAKRVAGNKTIFDEKGVAQGSAGKIQVDLRALSMAYDGDASNVKDVKFTISIDGVNVTIEASGSISATSLGSAITTANFKVKLAGGTLAKSAASTSNFLEINGVKWFGSISGGKLTLTMKKAPTKDSQCNTNFNVKVLNISGKGSDGSGKVSFNGSTNVGPSTLTVPKVAGGGNAANTVFEIKKSDIVDGTTITVGDKTITLAVGPNSAQDTSKASSVVDLTDMDPDDIDLNKALSAISKTLGSQVTFKGNNAKNESKDITFNVGVNSLGITVQRATVPQSNGEVVFTSLEKLANNFSMELGYVNTESKRNGGLMLQIGDSADSFNQLKVNIDDMHANAMGIGNIDISSQDGATEAMKKIKEAINYVSDTRGGLGATQNRLDHTINNLSVMQENIQDAESTIRDVDVAKEMMEYTKNNILVQSAQAMLAQANQLPQGVLQLLG